MSCTLLTNCEHITHYYWCWEQCLTEDFTSYIYWFNPLIFLSPWIHTSNNPVVALLLCADVGHNFIGSVVRSIFREHPWESMWKCQVVGALQHGPPVNAALCQARWTLHKIHSARHDFKNISIGVQHTCKECTNKCIFKGEARLNFTQYDISM